MLPSTALTDPLQIRRRQIRALDAHSKAPHVPRIVNRRKRRRARLDCGNDGRRCEQVLPDSSVDGERSRALGRLAHVMNPSGLSSRTISPVSVIQAVVFRPANSISTRDAGIGALAERTISRAPTFTVTGALRRVAGSNMLHRWLEPGASPSSASRRTRLSESIGRSARRRTSVRVRPPLVIEISRSRPRTVPPILIGPVPGSSANSNDCSSNARFTRRGRAQRGDRVRAQQRHLQLSVFLQLEAAFVASLACRDRHCLAHGEADLLAAVVHAAPLRRRAVPREVGREIAGRVHVGPLDEDAP